MLSSLKLTSFTPFAKQEIKKLKAVWQALQDNNDSIQFRLPVDWQGLGLTDYLTIIHNPMDLNTVNNKIIDEHYQSIEEALDDLQLIWDNCKLYNQKGSWIYDKAEKLQRLFKKQVKTHLPMITLPGPPGKSGTAGNSKVQNQEIKIEQKVKFVQKIKILKPEELGVVVAKIQQLCPHTFKEGEGEKVQILIDQIDLNSWKKILEVVDNLEDPKDSVLKKQKM